MTTAERAPACFLVLIGCRRQFLPSQRTRSNACILSMLCSKSRCTNESNVRHSKNCNQPVLQR